MLYNIKVNYIISFTTSRIQSYLNKLSFDYIEKIQEKGVQIVDVLLHVGLGTFRPVKCENILDHKMDTEAFEISEETAELINKAKAQGKNIVAVGTTTVRTLESAYKIYGEIKACKSASPRNAERSI